MLKTNVMIREDQEEKLKAISLRTGIEHDELVRRGVDMVIAEKQAMDDEDWHQALKAIVGIWEDYDELDDLLKEERDKLKNRHAKLFVDHK